MLLGVDGCTCEVVTSLFCDLCQLCSDSMSSLIWDYFTPTADKNSAKCNSCGHDYKTSLGGTGSLKNHLRS